MNNMDPDDTSVCALNLKLCVRHIRNVQFIYSVVFNLNSKYISLAIVSEENFHSFECK